MKQKKTIAHNIYFMKSNGTKTEKDIKKNKKKKKR